MSDSYDLLMRHSPRANRARAIADANHPVPGRQTRVGVAHQVAMARTGLVRSPAPTFIPMSFAGLADHVPSERINELERFARRCTAGGGNPGEAAQLLRDFDELALLTRDIAPLDQGSWRTLHVIGELMYARVLALTVRNNGELDVDRGNGIPLAEHEERQQRYLEAGDQIREGMFANMFFTLEMVHTGDRDLAARKAAAGAAIDGVVSSFATMAEARDARTRSSRPGPNQPLPSEAAVVGVDGAELPGMPEPAHPRQPTTRRR